jgi:hypothetical protein
MKQSGRGGLSPWPSEIVDYISFMTKECTVIYNGDCPICSREIDVYRDRVTKAGGSLGFVDLNRVDLGAFGLTADDAARRLYVVRGDELLSGVDFRASMLFCFCGTRRPAFSGLHVGLDYRARARSQVLSMSGSWHPPYLHCTTGVRLGLRAVLEGGPPG